MRELLLGAHAVAQGALDAGIGGAFSYPGTPATEIFEHVERVGGPAGVAARWSGNEKVAYEAALGMSYVGRRALVSMKHVGVNVAADPLMGSALTGVNGGLVVAVGDDPGMHSSQNEQDSRFYAQFAQIPAFEPADPQQAYDMTREAFDVSERFNVPVLLRLVTRLAHGTSVVHRRPPTPPPARPARGDWHHWTLLPANARACYGQLLEMQPQLLEFTSRHPSNRLELRGRAGVIVTGVARNYFAEAAGADHAYSVLEVGAYPLAPGLVAGLVAHCDRILVLEEGYPLVERQLNGFLGIPGKAIEGRLTGAIPPQGELTVDLVRAALHQRTPPARPAMTSLPTRPPQLCAGCPHCDSYRAILDAVGSPTEHYYFGDIGCYALSAMPPYSAVDTCVEMGASIGMAIGAARAGARPVIATIGDSTFLHSGLTSLIEAACDDLDMTVVILDNALVAMTGGQRVFATGDDLARIILGLGVNPEHFVRLEPLARRHDEQVEIFRREIEHRGLSVILASRPCIHAKRREATRPAVAAAPA